MHSITIDVRVRYHECDPMSVAHHSVYPTWLEIARADLLRHAGVSYAELEARGTFIVVTHMSFEFKAPAYYDEVLQISATLKRAKGVRFEFDHEIHRDGQLLAVCHMKLACLDANGKPTKVPEQLRID